MTTAKQLYIEYHNARLSDQQGQSNNAIQVLDKIEQKASYTNNDGISILFNFPDGSCLDLNDTTLVIMDTEGTTKR